MYCKNCGTQIPDDSQFCNSCGANQWLANQWLDISTVNCEENQTSPSKNQKRHGRKKDKKKDSTLSVVAIVLCLFTITFIPGIICALIDLTLNDKEKDHGYSWLAIILGVIIAIAIINH